LIINEEADKRETIAEVTGTTYIFDLTQNFAVDAMFVANKSRFMNHSKLLKNVTPKIKFVNGGYKIGMFALRDIEKGEELFFDYDSANKLATKYPWIEDDAGINKE